MFFNVSEKRKLTDKDICSFQEWMVEPNAHKCCRHSDGFLIFVEPEKLDLSDEYKDGDPYSVSININSAFQTRRRTNTIKLLKDMKVQKDAKLLDLGCGEGHLTDEIKKTFPEFEVHGLDYSISAIRYAHEKYKNIDFVVADAYQPPYPDQYFDIVILNNIWEHVPDPLQLLATISRILKKSGVILISTPSRYRFSNLLRVLRGKQIVFMSKLHVTEYTIGQVREQLKFGGYTLNIVHSTPIREHTLPVHICKVLLRSFLTIIKSQHNLEGTVFYVASKN